jgi:flagellar assembly protein FliH
MPAGASDGGETSARSFIGEKDRARKSKPATIEEVEQNAYCRGFADGEKKGIEQGVCAGTQAAENRLDPLLASLRQVLSELQTLRRQTCAALEAELVALALGVARKIVGREVAGNPDQIAGVIRKALSCVEPATRITIRLNPSDLKRLNEARPQLLSGLPGAQQVCFEADAGLDPGGCFIETDAGDVDARLQHQLQVVEDAFRTEWSQDATQMH